jgi:hypothetical protein
MDYVGAEFSKPHRLTPISVLLMSCSQERRPGIDLAQRTAPLAGGWMQGDHVSIR